MCVTQCARSLFKRKILPSTFIAQGSARATMRYATFGIPKMSKWDIKKLRWGEIISFKKKTGRFNTEPIPKVDLEIAGVGTWGMNFSGGKVKKPSMDYLPCFGRPSPTTTRIQRFAFSPLIIYLYFLILIRFFFKIINILWWCIGSRTCSRSRRSSSFCKLS